MQNWLSNFQYFSFQSSNFQFCHFSTLTFNCCQFGAPLDLNYLLPLSQNDIVLIFFKLKKIKKTIIKKKKLFFSHFLYHRTLSHFLSLSLCLTVPWYKASLPLPTSTHNLLAIELQVLRNLSPLFLRYVNLNLNRFPLFRD